MGKQFYISQNENDVFEFVNLLFQNDFKLVYGIAHKTDDNLSIDQANICWNYRWEYREIKDFDTFLDYYKSEDNCGDPLSIYKGELEKLKPYNENFFTHKDYSFYPMIEYTPNYRLWISSEAKGMSIWNDFDLLKKWFSSVYFREKINHRIMFIGKNKMNEI